MITTTRLYNEYTRIEYSVHEGRVFYDCVDMSGLMKLMRGHEKAVATFGQFEVAYDENVSKKIVRWTVYLGTDDERRQYGPEDWRACHESSNGEWWDDLARLKDGDVEWVN